MKDLNLMIVEDEDKLRDGLQRALSGFFAKLITAKNGDEGLKKIQKIQPRPCHHGHFNAYCRWT